MTNRFVEVDNRLRPLPRRGRTATLSSAATRFVRPMAASDRALVILIENGGVDLGIPALVDKLLEQLPGADLIPSSAKSEMVTFLHDKIKGLTDSLLETAELTLNRYSSAKPDLVGDVVVLRDGTASYDDLKRTLISLSTANKIIDVFVLTHGGANSIAVTGGITGDKLRAIKTEHGAPLRIRAVYMMNCVGSSLNQAWIDSGAKASAGSIRNNYLPEPTMYFFWNAWKNGQSFETAVTSAYRRTIATINGAIRGFISALPIPGSSLLADQIDIETFDFVKDSAPVIQGNRSVTITSDSLSFTQSLSSSLATTVLPLSVLEAVADSSATPVRAVSPHGMELIRTWEGDAGNVADRVAAAQEAVRSCVRTPLNQNQHDALVSFVCGVGIAAFKSSSLLQKLNAGDHGATLAELRKWVKVRRDGAVSEDPALLRRRAAEADLYRSTERAAAQSLSLLARSFGAVDAEITGILPVIKQPSRMTCWAAVMTMMWSWRNNQSTSIRDALAGIGQQYVDMFDRGQGLDSVSAARLYDTAGLARMTSLNPTIDEWARLITTCGPLYVDVGYGESNTTHAIIVRAIKGDGTAEGTNITYVDPDDAQTRTVVFRDFLRSYEAPGAVRWPHVIVHWPMASTAPTATPAVAEQSSRYRSPSSVMSTETSSWSYQQNPVVAGIALADAIQIGLGTVAIAQAGVSASAGSFQLTYDRAQRILTNEARQAMPGAQVPKEKYRRSLLNLSPGQVGQAVADIFIEWEGNTYGEIGTPVIDRNLTTSTDWSRSSANISITKLERIPLPNTDPRTWPIVYTYTGTYDPIGNGHWEFQGEFEISAFGGLKFTKHEVVSRSAMDFAIGGSPEQYVRKGADNVVAVPTIPADQLAYLRTKLS